MLSALFIFDSKGDTLISKIYKDEVKQNISEVFRIQVIASNSLINSKERREVRSPVLTLGSTSFIHIKSGTLWMCAVTRSNQDCSVIMEFLFKLEEVLKSILAYSAQKKELTEELVINNFYFIFELLDEVAEFGFPRSLELAYLKNHVELLPSHDKIFKLPSSVLPGNTFSNQKKNNKGITNRLLNVSWRIPDLKYRRNEVFLNVEENLHVLMNSHSEILRAYVNGTIQMKTHLSGMPLCQLGLSEDSPVVNSLTPDSALVPSKGAVVLEDCKFHQCVEKNKFDSERVIQFVPPDGEFQLMSYNCLLNLEVPFRVYTEVSESTKRSLHYKIVIKSLFPSKIPAASVQMRIPTPKKVSKATISCSLGKGKYHPEENEILWKFNKFLGQKEHILEADVDLAGIHQTDGPMGINILSKPVIKLEFDLEMFSVSGLTVKFLKVNEATNYRVIKWIKYSCRSGSFDIRC